MRRIQTLWLALLLIAISSAQTEAQKFKKISDPAVRKLISTDRGCDPLEGYARLFKLVGPEGVRQLKRSKIDQVAIRSAWEQVTHTVPVKSGKKVYRPDRASLIRFIGFLEGRGRLNVPKWWSDSIIDSRANQRDNIYPSYPKEYVYINPGPKWATAPRRTKIEKSKKGYLLKIDANSVRLPPKLLKPEDAVISPLHISAKFSPTQCVVVIHDSVGYPFTLATIDRKSQKLLWKKRGWGCWSGGISGVGGWSRVQVTVQDDRIVVFGLASLGFYVEAYESKTGKNLFRVSNNF